jgi:predicted metal-binding protein
MTLLCPECPGVALIDASETEKRYSRYNEFIRTFHFLKCPKCGNEYVPEIILHPRLKSIKIKCDIKL